MSIWSLTAQSDKKEACDARRVDGVVTAPVGAPAIPATFEPRCSAQILPRSASASDMRRSGHRPPDMAGCAPSASSVTAAWWSPQAIGAGSRRHHP